MKPEKPKGCELCHRPLKLHFHHLIPKKMHNKRFVRKNYDQEYLDHYGIWLCSDCHKFLHSKISHKELALRYNDLAKLKKHPELEIFINWVSRQFKNVK